MLAPFLPSARAVPCSLPLGQSFFPTKKKTFHVQFLYKLKKSSIIFILTVFSFSAQSSTIAKKYTNQK
jgi:hypothetical protein